MENNIEHISGQEELEEMEYFEYEKYSPELWAAKFGHLILCGDGRNYTYENKSFEKWIHELFRIIHTVDLTTLREKLLSIEEIKTINKEIEKGF
jgi:hypothetical protein